MYRMRLTNRTIAKLAVALLLGTTFSAAGCSWKPRNVEAFSLDQPLPAIALDEMAILPAQPFKIAKSGDEYVMLNRARDQVFWGRFTSDGTTAVGGKGSQAGFYLNPTDVGFATGRDELYVFDQKNQRLSFFARDGSLRSTLPLGFLGIMGVNVSFHGDDYLIHTTPESNTGHRVIRVDSEGNWKHSFYPFPAKARAMKLRPLSVPYVVVQGDEIWAGQSFSWTIERFADDATHLGSFGEAPAFYRKPSSRADMDGNDMAAFRQWYRSWTPLFAVFPYRDGVARVFQTHRNPRFVIDFVGPDGRQLRGALATDATPFAIEANEIFLFEETKVLRGVL